MTGTKRTRTRLQGKYPPLRQAKRIDNHLKREYPRNRREKGEKGKGRNREKIRAAGKNPGELIVGGGAQSFQQGRRQK